MASLDVLLGKQEAGLKSALVDGTRLKVIWEDGTSSEFPLLILRDCCTCEKCFSPTVNSRLTLFEQLLGTNCKASDVTVQVSNIHAILWLTPHDLKLSKLSQCLAV